MVSSKLMIFPCSLFDLLVYHFINKDTLCSIQLDCFFLTGPKCQCWKFVCGDCCWHKGCYQHDKCCHQIFSVDCLDIRGFSCDGGFPKYPGCITWAVGFLVLFKSLTILARRTNGDPLQCFNADKYPGSVMRGVLWRPSSDSPPSIPRQN